MKINCIPNNLMKGLLLVVLLTLEGCSANSFTAPTGSTISVNQSSVTYTSIAGDVTKNLTVTVKDSNNNPLNNAQVFISGSMASPRTPARYQFYRDVNANTPVDSGFTATTNSFGQYSFSIKVYATVGGVASTFTDTIDIISGGASASVALSLT